MKIKQLEWKKTDAEYGGKNWTYYRIFTLFGEHEIYWNLIENKYCFVFSGNHGDYDDVYELFNENVDALEYAQSHFEQLVYQEFMENEN